MAYEFDTFISYNSEDRKVVERLAETLKERGIKPWFDLWQITPGTNFIASLENAIPKCKSALIAVGPNGLSPWHKEESLVLQQRVVKHKLRVIPVLLPGAGKVVELPPFMEGLNWVDLRHGLSSDALDKLIWGITGIRPVIMTDHLNCDEVILRGTTAVWPQFSVSFGGPKVCKPFVGRQEELRQLTKAMQGPRSVVAVVGMPGQGKSCLVGQWHMYEAKLPKGIGIFWRKVYETGYTFSRFLDQLQAYLTREKVDSHCVPKEDQAAVIEGLLAKRPCWIILDGVERWLTRWANQPDAGVGVLTSDERAAQDPAFDKFLRSACFWNNGSRLLLTTRAIPSALDENPPVMIQHEAETDGRLTGLKADDAVRLLDEFNIKGQQNIKLEAVQAYGCHAYAVHVLGVLLRDLYGGNVSHWTEVTPLAKDKFTRLFERIIEHQSEDLALLEYLACSVEPATVAMLSDLTGLDHMKIRQSLARLTEWQMVEFDGERAEQHTVVRLFLRERMKPDRICTLRQAIATWRSDGKILAEERQVGSQRATHKTGDDTAVDPVISDQQIINKTEEEENGIEVIQGTESVSETSVYVCHSSRDLDFVFKVAGYLKRGFKQVYCYHPNELTRKGSLNTREGIIQECSVFLLLLSEKLTSYQIAEIRYAYEMYKTGKHCQFIFCLLSQQDLLAQFETAGLGDLIKSPIIESRGREAEEVATCIMQVLNIPFVFDGLPLNPNMFSYEKDILRHFAKIKQLGNHKQSIAEDEKASDELDQLHAMVLEGCPTEWPKVICRDAGSRELVEEYKRRGVPPQNILQKVETWASQVGHFVKKDAQVIVEARTAYHQSVSAGSKKGECFLVDHCMCLPEAGPRDTLHFPRKGGYLKVAVLVSGGIAPGTNAAINGIVQRHVQYANEFGYFNHLGIVGIKNGFLAFKSWDDEESTIDLKTTIEDISSRASESGSLLGTSQVDFLSEKSKRQKMLNSIVQRLSASAIDILYVIGDNDSLKAAHALATVAQAYARTNNLPPLSVVAIPKTMENDILWAWPPFGFQAGVEKTREIIDHLSTEVASNPRLCIAQLYGSDSGFTVSHAVLASRPEQCDVALIPEIDFSIKELAEYLRKKMNERNETVPRGLLIMGETAIPSDAKDFIAHDKTIKSSGKTDDLIIGLTQKEEDAILNFDPNKRIEGQTPDELRSAGLKLVSRGLKYALENPEDKNSVRYSPRIVTNEPRHLLRAIPPSCTDIIMGTRLGTLAVDNAIAGYNDFMISQWLTEYVLVPLDLVVLGRKRIPKDGIFWKSVIAKTGQPLDLTSSDT